MKYVKSTLNDDFTIEQKLNRITLFIVDGGYLLHAVTWNNDFCKTYHVIWNVQKIISCRQKYLSVVFDSYNELDSAKKSEHLHTGILPHCFRFQQILHFIVIKGGFLCNIQNKKQFIIMLIIILQNKNFDMRQS